MISDHNLDSSFSGQLQFIPICCAAIHGDNQPYPIPGHLLYGLRIEAVALDQSVRDVIGYWDPKAREEINQQGRGGYPIRVVVAVDGDVFLVLYGAHDRIYRHIHILQKHGIFQAGESGTQKGYG